MKQSQSFVYSFHSVLSVLEAQAETIQVIYVQIGRKDKRMASVLSLAEKQDIAIKPLSSADITKRFGEINHQGVVAVVHSQIKYDEAFLLTHIEQSSKPCLLLVLDGVKDPHNLGACLRSAAALGADAVIVPKDRAVGMTPVVERVACGAAQVVPLITATNLARLLQKIQQQGVWLVGLDAGSGQLLTDMDLTIPTALVMGSEGSGLRRLTKNLCDFEASIPLTAKVESLNVSAAAAIALYEAVRQRF